MSPQQVKKNFKKCTEYKCSICNIDTWLEKHITLEIDHIDGNNKNNDFSNLRYLCPNCHSQTLNWRGRNKNSGKIKVTDEQLLNAIKESENIRQALIKVGLAPKGPNYARVSNLIISKEMDFNNSQYGTLWINDGIKNKKIKKELLDDYIKCGYVKGRIPTYIVQSPKGKIWVNNGIKNRLVYPDKIPDGFWKGKFQKLK